MAKPRCVNRWASSPMRQGIRRRLTASRGDADGPGTYPRRDLRQLCQTGSAQHGHIPQYGRNLLAARTESAEPVPYDARDAGEHQEPRRPSMRGRRTSRTDHSKLTTGYPPWLTRGRSSKSAERTIRERQWAIAGRQSIASYALRWFIDGSRGRDRPGRQAPRVRAARRVTLTKADGGQSCEISSGCCENSTMPRCASTNGRYWSYPRFVDSSRQAQWP